MQIEYKNASKLLTPASGYLTGYTHTLNPYAGCAYACSYCYVRRMPVALFRGKEWGEWVDVKQNAVQQLRKELRAARKKGPVSIFMSSSTDPYQPVEFKEQITRALLEAMAESPPDFLFLQTRGLLVTRDMDLLGQMKDRVRISMTIETDREEVRRVFTPSAPPLSARMNALRTLHEAGFDTQATVAPVLPSTEQFAERLADLTSKVCIDDYFMGDGQSGRRTSQLPVKELYERLDAQEWYSPDAYKRVQAAMLGVFAPDRVMISREGFLPSFDKPI